MKGHVGAVITSGLAVLALALALLQATILHHTAHKDVVHAAAPAVPSNRFSAPGGRSGIPWLPFEKAQPPADREGRSPPRQQQEEHHAPPRRDHSLPPRFGPQLPRRLTA
jgi:hypothetical protein